MKIKELFIEFGSCTTCHGIPNITRVKSLTLRIMWLFFFLVSKAFCCYMIFTSIDSFFDFEVVTKIHIENHLPIEFPTISICNLNPYVKEEAKQYFSENNGNLTEQFGDYIWGIYNFLKIHNLSSQVKKSFGLNLSEFIYECYFDNDICDYENDFVWFYDFDNGNCFKYNSGKNATGHTIDKKKVYKIGKDPGLNLKIFTSNSYQDFTGLKIIIHNSSVNPSSNEGFEVPTGFKTNVAVNRLFIYKKEYPYSNCISDIGSHKSELVQAILKTGYKYRQIDCFDLCQQSFIINNAGCYFPGLLKRLCI